MGLGIRFLRHVMRTRVLLHLVDMAPLEGTDDPVQQVRAIERELVKFDTRFDASLAARPRWLVINKSDLLEPEVAQATAAGIVAALQWREPWFLVSAATGEGTREVTQAAMSFMERTLADEREAQREARAMTSASASAAKPAAEPHADPD